MWLELRASFTIITMLVLSIVASILIVTTDGVLFGVMVLIGMGIMVAGVFIEGMRITGTNANKWIDRPPAGFVPILLITLTNEVDVVWAKRKPHGKREFVYNGEEATVIDLGDYPIHFPSGATGCIAHEKSRQNVNCAKARYSQEVKDVFKTDDIKEIYYKAKKLDAREERENAE